MQGSKSRPWLATASSSSLLCQSLTSHSTVECTNEDRRGGGASKASQGEKGGKGDVEKLKKKSRSAAATAAAIRQ